MAKKITLRQMGGSIGATIPKVIAERFHLNQGDEVFVSETDKGILITPVLCQDFSHASLNT